MAAAALLQASAPTCSCCNGASLSSARMSCSCCSLFAAQPHSRICRAERKRSEVKLDCAALVTSAGGDLRAAAPAGAQQHRP